LFCSIELHYITLFLRQLQARSTQNLLLAGNEYLVVALVFGQNANYLSELILAPQGIWL